MDGLRLDLSPSSIIPTVLLSSRSYFGSVAGLPLLLCIGALMAADIPFRHITHW